MKLPNGSYEVFDIASGEVHYYNCSAYVAQLISIDLEKSNGRKYSYRQMK